MSASKFVFIVGVSRSGTTLMRRILNKSTQIALCDENYYLGHLVESEGVRFKFRRFGDLQQDDNVRRLVEFIFSPEFETYSRLKTLNWQWRWFREAKIPILLKLFLLGQVTFTWRDGLRRWRRHAELYGDSYRLVQFEELVSDPQSGIPALCQWMGVEYQEQMMAQNVVSEGFQSGTAGFDAQASRRWEKHIDSWARKWIEFRFRKELAEVGYAR